jgi:serine/threonine protein kinase
MSQKTQLSQLQTPPKNGNLLGSGSYGKVYMVNNLARKVMDYTYDDGKLHEKNLNEIAFLSTYRSIPFIPKYNSTKFDGKKIELLMEYCGMNLEKYASSKTYVERVKMIPSLLKQFSKMLLWMKNQSVVHVDVKPANICIDENGNMKLIDWGFVTYLTKNSTEIYGTEYFADPYTLQYGELTKNYDMYSVGMTLCWFLTKTFQSEDWKKMMNDFMDKTVSREEINYDNINSFLGDYVKESMVNVIDNGIMYYSLICRMIDVNIKTRITPEELHDILSKEEMKNTKTVLDKYEFLEYNSTRDLSKQKITHNQIAILVEWLLQIKSKYNLYSSVEYSIELLYRVLEANSINTDDLQLLGICCLIVSTHANCDDILDIDDYVYFCKETYTSEQIENGIKNIYTLLDFKVYPTYTVEGLTHNCDYKKWHNLYLTYNSGKLTMRRDTFDILDRLNEMCNLGILDTSSYEKVKNWSGLSNYKMLNNIKFQYEKKVIFFRMIKHFLSLVDNSKLYDSVMEITINMFKYIIKHKDFFKNRTDFSKIISIIHQKYSEVIFLTKNNKTKGLRHKKSKSNIYYYNKLIELKNDMVF